MICPRCKGENKEEATICSKCNLKLKTLCPRCKSLNKIGQSVCSNCNLKLIRFCPNCKTPNFPNAPTCRKCQLQLLKPKSPQHQTTKPDDSVNQQTQTSTPVEKKQETTAASTQTATAERTPQESGIKQTDKINKSTKFLSRADAHDHLVNTIKTSENGLIIDITSLDGGGKSTLISGVTSSLKEEKFVWMVGMCQPINQLVPYAFFQDLFKTFFGLPLYVVNMQESQDTLNKILETNLEINDPQINNVLGRVLFNNYNECIPSIIENRELIHETLYKFIDALNQKSDLAIIIEDIEYIDNASLECIKHIVNKGFINKKNFIFINHQPNINLHEIFPIESLKNKILTIHFKSMPPEELKTSMLGMLNEQDIIPEKIKSLIFEKSRDVPLYMEQALWYLFQTGAIIAKNNSIAFNPKAAKMEIPKNLDDLIIARIKLVNNVSPDATRIILAASLFGTKFIPPFAQMISEVEEQQFNQIVQMLINTGIFVMQDQLNFRFKHCWIWRIIYEKIFTDEQILSYSPKIIDLYKKYTPTISKSILIRHVEETDMKKEAFDLYNQAAGECICLGDINSYNNYLNQILEHLPEAEIPEEQKTVVKINIDEQIGRANFELNPQLAMNSLSNAIETAEKENNIVKVIDLTGYLARSCELSGNYSGVIECCDKALSIINKEKQPLENILLNFYKLESLFNLGRLEETSIQATNEIIPNIKTFISKNKTIKGISLSDLQNIQTETELILAKTYVYQGNKLALQLAASIAEKAEKENLLEVQIKAHLLQALFLAIQGDMKASNTIISTIKEKFNEIESPEKLKLEWYFIAIISNIINGSFRQASDLCYTAMTIAKYFNDYNLLYLIKLVLGKCFEEMGQLKEAYQIYDDVVNHCSENKMATGALLSWYLASASEYKLGNFDKALDVAERALEICQKPTISNNIIETLLNTLISKARRAKKDYERAQINIENAINKAEANELHVLLAEAYLNAAKIHHETLTLDPSKTKAKADQANRLYTKAITLTEQINNHLLMAKIEKEFSLLLADCKNAQVVLEKVN